MPSYPNQGLTNSELIKYLSLPEDIIDALATEQGATYTAKANEFLEALFNKVLYQTVTSADFSNPFKKYDGFPVNFGDTIENIFVEIPKGYKYDKDATDPFARANPAVKTLYASINYEMQYESTIYDSLLRRACLNEYGFMNLIDTILGALAKAVSIDEYFATIKMLANADLFAEGIEEVEKGATDSDTAAIVTKKIVDTVSAFQLPMTANNKAGVMTCCNPDKVLLVIKYGLLNSINLDFLTGVFNLSKVDLVKHIIPVDGFQISQWDSTTEKYVLEGEDSIDFMLLDTDAFDMHTALQDGGMIYNPKGKYTNHFMNLWKIVSFKYFYNARAFKLVEPSNSNDSEQVGG